jgi:CRP/FNR family transcriptional regulator, cyclic AMP receptor protein
MTRGYVRLLQVQPLLGTGLQREDIADARRLAVAPVASLSAGRPGAAELRRLLREEGAIGCLVVDGMITDDLTLAGRVATHLLGRGDILPRITRPSRLLQVRESFGVTEGTRVAVLDETFSAMTRRWPSIAGALLAQAARQAQRVAVQELISHLPRADQRIVALLWHLADRWGRAEPEGVVVPVMMGHEAIARLVGGRRPTISSALGRLGEQGLVCRQSNGTWRLDPASRALLNPAVPPDPAPSIRLLSSRARNAG